MLVIGISFRCAHHADMAGKAQQPMGILKIACEDVRHELANYMEDDVSIQLRLRIERHFAECNGCFAIYDDLRKIVRLIGSSDVIELPRGFSQRLYQRIRRPD